MQFYAEDPDDLMAGVGRYWDNYFGADKVVFHKNEKLVKLTELLASRELSLTILSGNLLEHAKKGLSLVYGPYKDWPIGRKVGSQPLSKVILQFRLKILIHQNFVKLSEFIIEFSLIIQDWLMHQITRRFKFKIMELVILQID